jgi:hypothetical protein
MAERNDFPQPSCDSRGHYSFDEQKVDDWLLLNDWSRGNIAHNPHIIDRIVRETEEKRMRLEALGEPPNQGSAEKLPPSVQKMRDVMEQKTAKGRIQTELLQLEFDKKKGLLVSRSEVIQEFAPKIARLAKGLEMMPNLFGKKWGLDDKKIKELRDYMDELRFALSRDDGGILSDKYVPKLDSDDE